VPLALGSAALFGGVAPISKLLLGATNPWLLAAMLYLGAGLGLLALHLGRRSLGLPRVEASLRRADLPWLAAVVIVGGGLAPVLLLGGVWLTSSSTASLMLNLEGLATMAIAWIVFRENVDRRLLVGAAAILLGAAVLTWTGGSVSFETGALLVAAACLCWGIDNNLSRRLSSADPVQVAMIKGLGAGAANLILALATGSTLPGAETAALAGLVGFAGIGVSLVMFMRALRHLGTARTGAYYSLAPFIGAAMSLAVLREPLTANLLIAAALMAIGLWLHLAERHDHEHLHDAIEHEHSHLHDEHHQHAHEGPLVEPHTHRHRHEPLRHSHPHYPDLHHRHRHG
jgi:drug/metabolite transporter (DMT)-like permease